LQHANTTSDEDLHTLFRHATAFGESRWKRRLGATAEIVFRHACKLGCEGIVSKRLGSPYRSGRSAHWVKVKNPAAQAVKRVSGELIPGLEGEALACLRQASTLSAVAFRAQ
jgi:hypothetical protein